MKTIRDVGQIKKKNICPELPEISYSGEKLTEIKTPALIVGIFVGTQELPKEIQKIDGALGGRIKKVISSGDFKGKRGDVVTLYHDVEKKDLGAERIILSGLGEKEKLSVDVLKSAAALGIKKAVELKLSSAALPWELASSWSGDVGAAAEAVSIGSALGCYRYDMLKKNNEEKTIKDIIIVGEKEECKKGAEQGRIIADSVYLARNLSNAPANLMTPRIIARQARELARRYGIICDVFWKSDLKKMKMGAFLGVAKGSSEPPALIVMEYMPKEKRAGAVALVGKGITFDSGGISLKPPERMEIQKTDMSGAATVMGAVIAAARLKLKTGVIGIIPATENMPSGTAQRPGDVVTAMDGTTIEIISTDAEGRLILADALTFAKKYKPSAIIDMATLTGAAIISLGTRVSPLYSHDDSLIENLKRASEQTGEQIWPMPLYDHYSEQMKSDIADLKNVGGRDAGSITAAAFLKKFAGDSSPWAHIDIAGTARADKEYDWVSKGSSGWGVMLLVKFLEIIS
jgi:leucyl aminopeptidase